MDSTVEGRLPIPETRFGKRSGKRLDNRIYLGLQHYCQEYARLAADGDHAMAAAGVVHQAIAGAELLDMIFVGEAHPAGDDEIELLAGMVGKVDRLILLLLKIRSGDDERLGKLVLEARGLVQVLETGAALDGQALPARVSV